ncbi:hypothetical protein PG996_003513 [Apiospora saccharicola]|uniref:Cysteine-rich transmembrane CYSTM domain-containing protein n=1 Tax=Apiospora saccharicola TaxID=335842 RepID=A0ABR1W5B9_9PEZI
MDPSTTPHYPPITSPPPAILGPVEVWMEIPLVTVTEVTDQEPKPEPQPQAQPLSSNPEEPSSANPNTTPAALRGGDDDYEGCCEVCCSSMVICLRCWLCCGCHYDD